MSSIRYIKILFLVFLFFGIIKPVNAENLSVADAYKAVVKVEIYALDEYFQLSKVGSGSGVIIDSSGLLLTNYHVAVIEDYFDDSIDEGGYIVCVPESAGVEPDCSYTAELVASNKDLDMAILQIKPITGLSNKSSFEYLELNSSDTTNINDEITAIGYPAIGGDTVTVSQGTISGKQNNYNVKWIKTDAVTSFGSSGGAAIDVNAKVIGITTQAYSDMIGSFGYIISMDSIYDWIIENKNKIPQVSSFETRIKNIAIKKNNVKFSNEYSNSSPGFTITKPSDWDFSGFDESGLLIEKEDDDEGGIVFLSWTKYPVLADLDMIIPHVKNDLGDSYLISKLNILNTEDININGKYFKKVSLAINSETINYYYAPVSNYILEMVYDYGSNDKDKSIIDQIISSIVINDNSSFVEKRYYVNEDPNFSIDLDNNWAILEKNVQANPIFIVNKNREEVFVHVTAKKSSDDIKNMDRDSLLGYYKDNITNHNSIGALLDFNIGIIDSSAHVNLNSVLNDVLMVESSYKKISTGEILIRSLSYVITLDDYHIAITMNSYADNEEDYNQEKEMFKELLQGFNVSGLSSSSGTGQQAQNENQNQSQSQAGVNIEMSNRLKGKLLLQVEDRGRIWYVNPEDGKRHEVTFANALNLFEQLALGVSTADLNKIPIDPESLEEGVDTDGDGYDDKTEAEYGYNPELASDPNNRGNDKVNYDSNLYTRLEGKLLLQVEDRGRIWYVDFDGKRHEVTWDNLMDLFRKLSLGITDSDLNQIGEGSL